MQNLSSKYQANPQLRLAKQNPTSSKNYDIAIVGSGISCTYTLIHYISKLKQRSSKRSSSKLIKVAVLDKSGEFWTGVAYGSRTGRQSLIITPLKEFLPDLERALFIAWLQDNYDSVLLSLQTRAGILNNQWLQSYQEAMSKGNWDELFLPRYLFGWYLNERIEGLLQEAQQKNLLRCDLITADISNITKRDDLYHIEADSISLLSAQKVVLAIGSPASQALFMPKPDQAINQADICCITNMYEPSQNSNIQRITTFLKEAEPSHLKQIVIIGSNASALETIYSLSNIPEISTIVDKFIVVSPSGEFPHLIGQASAAQNYIPQHLEQLLAQEQFTAQDIYHAVQADVQQTLEQDLTVDSTYQEISQRVIKALNLLNYEEQKSFVTKYGITIGKYQRRAGQDYLNVAEKLTSIGKLQFIKGKFAGIVSLSAKTVGLQFLDANNQLDFVTAPIQVLINCAGFQNLTQSSSPLIRNLIKQRICTPNESLGGFQINENFEAHPNLYLMGPLVAGNINERLKVWHAESCGRIFNLSQSLAEVLAITEAKL